MRCPLFQRAIWAFLHVTYFVSWGWGETGGGVGSKALFKGARAAIGRAAHHSDATLLFAAIFSAKRVSGDWRGA
jgi:hypothetical protein